MNEEKKPEIAAEEIRRHEQSEAVPRGNVADREDDERLTEAPPPMPN